MDRSDEVPRSQLRSVQPRDRVVVVRGRRWEIVHLHKLYVMERDGRRRVSLSDIWVASGLRGDLFSLVFDMLDERGVAATRWGQSKLEGERFLRGWLDIDTRDVDWDEHDDVGQEWRMRSVATILATDSSARRRRRQAQMQTGEVLIVPASGVVAEAPPEKLVSGIRGR
ncbi:MAG TPA: hypothetical protein VGI39_41855 [Polyangiaceae bacterium]|jgi:hypothetical protein